MIETIDNTAIIDDIKFTGDNNDDNDNDACWWILKITYDNLFISGVFSFLNNGSDLMSVVAPRSLKKVLLFTKQSVTQLIGSFRNYN